MLDKTWYMLYSGYIKSNKEAHTMAIDYNSPEYLLTQIEEWKELYYAEQTKNAKLNEMLRDARANYERIRRTDKRLKGSIL